MSHMDERRAMKARHQALRKELRAAITTWDAGGPPLTRQQWDNACWVIPAWYRKNHQRYREAATEQMLKRERERQPVAEYADGKSYPQEDYLEVRPMLPLAKDLG
jgi:ABC-type phosphate transport system substrate-binding protein